MSPPKAPKFATEDCIYILVHTPAICFMPSSCSQAPFSITSSHNFETVPMPPFNTWAQTIDNSHSLKKLRDLPLFVRKPSLSNSLIKSEWRWRNLSQRNCTIAPSGHYSPHNLMSKWFTTKSEAEKWIFLTYQFLKSQWTMRPNNVKYQGTISKGS